jgi:hypothetical protein
LTFRAIAETGVEHFFSLDIPLLRTFIDLFRFPGRVASAYVAGRRKVYANPLKYNLIASAAIVAVIHLVVGGQPPSAPPQIGNSPFSRMLGEAMVMMMQWHNNYLQLLYIITLPALAGLLRVLLGPRSGRNMMEFYIMCLYAFGHLYLIQSACIMLAHWLKGTGFDTAFSLISGFSPYAYFPWMAAGFTRGNRWRAVLLSIAAFLIFSVVLSLTLLAIALVVLVLR